MPQKRNIVLILQAFGLGDVIWSQSIAHYFLEKGYRVMWPVEDHYFDGCMRAYPKIQFMPKSLTEPSLFEIKEKVIVHGIEISPIRWSNSYMKVPYKDVMRAKYDMYDLDWRSWKNHAMWMSDEKEQTELLKILGIKYGDKYNLVNKRFGTNAERSVEIQCNNGLRNIEMTEIEGYSLFDWTPVITGAMEIHTVSTAILFMLEMLPLAQPIHLYCRKPIEQNFNYVDYIFTKKYNLHL